MRGALSVRAGNGYDGRPETRGRMRLMFSSARQLGDLVLARAVEQITPFDRQAFFPGTTPDDWASHEGWLKPRGMDPETGNLLFSVQSYLVRTSHHTILIDSCVGNHKERPNRPLWHQKDDDAYMKAIAAQGISPDAIDFVMCTHLHADHVGWNTKLDNGRWVPTFKNAKYVFTKKEFDAWDGGGHEKFSRQPLEDSVLPIIAAGRAELVTNDHALDDEVWLMPTPGHTPDHVAVCLASRGQNAVMVGDTMHSPVQCLHPEWHPWPDWDPEEASRTRRELMERYCETDTLICTAHFPQPSAGRFAREGDAFRFVDDDQTW
jgi:glyoxylase-like metal-dependent hydrolase (beta-lactamase superfamily II)